MSDMNSVNIIGRLTRDAELKYTASGTAVCKFSLAVNEKRKAGDEWKDNANFFEIVLWGKVGESIQQYLTKGKQVAVIGKLTQERWDQDGQNRSKVVITAGTVQLLGSGKQDDGTGPNNSRGKGDDCGDYASPSAGSQRTPKWGGSSGGGSSVNSGGFKKQAPVEDDGFTDDIPF